MEEETKNASTETEKVAAAIEEKKEEKIEEKKEEKKEEKMETKKKKCKSSDFFKKHCKNRGALIAVIVLVVLIGISYGVKVYRDGQASDIGAVAIRAKVQKFVDANVPAGTTASIKDVSKDGNLYKVDITVGTQDVVTYVASDGSKLFSGVADLNAPAQAPAAASDQQAAASQPVPKSDKPDVRLFVMSYCPYGTQEEKGLLPVLSTLGTSINFSLEFVDYSMHNSLAQNDRKELDENMRQYCIEKNQPAALDTYLSCFLKGGQGTEASCMATAGVNASQVTSCMAQTDTQFNVTKDYNDQSSYQGGFPQFEVDKADNIKYGVQGSPTLVINGVQADSAGRDSASILKTICSAFNNQPKACQTQLSSTAPATGFGTAAASGAAASSAGAACATPQQ